MNLYGYDYDRELENIRLKLPFGFIPIYNNEGDIINKPSVKGENNDD